MVANVSHDNHNGLFCNRFTMNKTINEIFASSYHDNLNMERCKLLYGWYMAANDMTTCNKIGIEQVVTAMLVSLNLLQVVSINLIFFVINRAVACCFNNFLLFCTQQVVTSLTAAILLQLNELAALLQLHNNLQQACKNNNL